MTDPAAIFAAPDRLPLAGIRVVEMSQMVMGPTCGMILGDLGAEVIKVEPLPKGDRTRDLKGIGVGFFTAFNRNKKSLALDMKSPAARRALEKLVSGADVMLENFRPGGIERLGFGHAAMAALNPRLVYCTLKGFLPGPYENRAALDEVAQMMSGLAYMTGPPGKPMRAGASVTDIMGAMFAVIAIQAALAERGRTGRGQRVSSALFETCALMVSPFALNEVIERQICPPMSVRRTSWPIYDLFDTADGDQIFLAVVGDEQWRDFCAAFDRPAWVGRADLATMNERTQARDWLIPEVATIMKALPKAEIVRRCEARAIGFAPVNRPGQLLDDPHLAASGGLVEIELQDGRPARTLALPLAIGDKRMPLRLQPPKLGEHNAEVLGGLGYSAAEIAALSRPPARTETGGL
jgi:crotonobetainyl-CoA:carnitine CoA-transferase CaiB-like acyl-CoA transferase